MSMLTAQIDELRTLASELRQLMEYSADWTPAEAVTLASSVDAMREAADTILSLRDRLQEIQGVDNSCYYKLFGTPERAARTFADFCDACDKGECNDCPLDRLTNFCIGYKDLLEWLNEEVEQ